MHHVVLSVFLISSTRLGLCPPVGLGNLISEVSVFTFVDKLVDKFAHFTVRPVFTL